MTLTSPMQSHRNGQGGNRKVTSAAPDQAIPCRHTQPKGTGPCPQNVACLVVLPSNSQDEPQSIANRGTAKYNLVMPMSWSYGNVWSRRGSRDTPLSACTSHRIDAEVGYTSARAPVDRRPLEKR